MRDATTADPIAVLIGRKIAHRRKVARLTLDELARAAQISKTSLWEAEHAVTHISAVHLHRIATALNASMDYFVREA